MVCFYVKRRSTRRHILRVRRRRPGGARLIGIADGGQRTRAHTTNTAEEIRIVRPSSQANSFVKKSVVVRSYLRPMNMPRDSCTTPPPGRTLLPVPARCGRGDAVVGEARSVALIRANRKKAPAARFRKFRMLSAEAVVVAFSRVYDGEEGVGRLYPLLYRVPRSLRAKTARRKSSCNICFPGSGCDLLVWRK